MFAKKFFQAGVALTLFYTASVYSQCAGVACTLEAHFAGVDNFNESALSAFTEMVLEKNVEVRDSPEKLGYISNLGKLTIIGEQSRIAGVYAGDELIIKRDALVSNRLFALLVRQGERVKLPEKVEMPPDSHFTMRWSVEFPSLYNSEVTVSSNEARILPPGYYKSLLLRPAGKVILTTGSYYFDNLVSEVGSVFELKNQDGTVVVNVRDQLSHRGIFKSEAVQSDILVNFFGNRTVEIFSEFDGSLMAPNAQVVMYPAENTVHDGMYYADVLFLHPGTVVQKARLSGKGEAFASLKVQAFSSDLNMHQKQLSAKSGEDLPFTDTEIGRLLNDHFFKMYGTGENSIQEYEKSLEALRERADEVISEVMETYKRTPETMNTQMRRLTLVEIMRSLKHEAAYQPLKEIVYSEVSPDILAIESSHNFYPTRQEDIIRVRAISGIAGSGHVAVDDTLLDLMNKGTDFQKIYAAMGYLDSGDREQRMAAMRANLPQELHYLMNMDDTPLYLREDASGVLAELQK